MIRQIRSIREGDKAIGPFSYLNNISSSLPPLSANTESELRNFDNILRLYEYRALVAFRDVSTQFETDIQSGISWGDAFNRNALAIVEASKDHCSFFIASLFQESVAKVEDPACKAALERLLLVFGLSF
eukprot:TRINITY_DN13230_c0_g1_i1.p1 TRINITY_DN13230_c0_g1~~TRINITY_DN13230_c0_g1_i1.p1  ORF type:complete len:129 (-),score=12.90 TRINITY_DN13230_c0_g1_i1:42-428(-)